MPSGAAKRVLGLRLFSRPWPSEASTEGKSAERACAVSDSAARRFAAVARRSGKRDTARATASGSVSPSAVAQTDARTAQQSDFPNLPMDLAKPSGAFGAGRATLPEAQ